MSAEVVQIPSENYEARAKELRSEMMDALEKVCRIRDKAQRDGFIINFSVNSGSDGRNRVTDLSIMRSY